MNIYLGNIRFDQVREMLGYELIQSDRDIWNKYHSGAADLSEKESCFHVFDIPRCIQFKGEEAKQAILTIFTSEKLVEPMGEFVVYEKQ